MAKVERRRRENFTTTSNRIIEDERLSWKARGIFNYMWAQSSNWQFYMSELENHATDGRDALKSGIEELINYGYLKRKQSRRSGKFDRYDWVLFDIPLEQPSTEKPLTVKPNTENPAPENPQLTNTKETNTNNNNIDDIDLKPADFKKLLAEINDKCFPIDEKSFETKQLIKIFSEFSFEMNKAAVELAAYYKAENCRYIIATLEDWKARGITTIDQVKKHVERQSTSNSSKIDPKDLPKIPIFKIKKVEV